jgi:hypothetical protein
VSHTKRIDFLGHGFCNEMLEPLISCTRHDWQVTHGACRSVGVAKCETESPRQNVLALAYFFFSIKGISELKVFSILPDLSITKMHIAAQI